MSSEMFPSESSMEILKKIIRFDVKTENCHNGVIEEAIMTMNEEHVMKMIDDALRSAFPINPNQ